MSTGLWSCSLVIFCVTTLLFPIFLLEFGIQCYKRSKDVYIVLVQGKKSFGQEPHVCFLVVLPADVL